MIMTTFWNGSASMFASIAINIDKDVPKDVDVHTVTLLLNGQHGEFDLVVLGSDEERPDVLFEGVAFRSGGVMGFHRVEA